MKKFLTAQFENHFLWVPFIIAFGAIIYFGLSFEPNIAYPFIISILCASILIFKKSNIFITIALLFSFGFFYSSAFTTFINTAQIKYPLRNIQTVGKVLNINFTNNKTKVILKLQSDDIKATGKKIATVKLSIDDDVPIPNIGDILKANITLYPPSGAEAPDTFNFARYSYFTGQTGNGYLNHYQKINNDNNYSLNNLRVVIHKKNNSFLSDALVLGYKNIVPEQDYEIWKTAGVGHIWSISGFHISLVGGLLFLFFNLIFRSIPKITKRIPAKYPALIFTLFGLIFYMLLSGGAVATMRAVLMTGLIFTAFIVGRNVFSLRNISLVFILIFLMNPFYVMTAGFQLSFSAIFGLVWFFSDKKYEKKSVPSRIKNAIKITIQTSVVATIFTAPFIAYHFGSLPMYGLIGNLILIPIFSILIMPLVLIGTVTSLFGFKLPLLLANYIYDFSLSLANKITSMPYAQIEIPHIPSNALLIITIGFLCMMFIKNVGKIRINSILFFKNLFAGIIIIMLYQKPVFYSSSDNELVGFKVNDKLQFNKSRASNHYFAFNTWKKLNGELPGTPNHRYKHKSGVYNFKTENWNLIYIQKFMPLSKNIEKLCQDKDIDFIVSYLKIDAPNCYAKILHGGMTMNKSGNIKRITTGRPWDNRH